MEPILKRELERDIRLTFLCTQSFLLFCVPLLMVFYLIHGVGIYAAIFITKFIIALSLFRVSMQNSLLKFVVILILLSITLISARFQKHNDIELFIVEFVIAMVLVPASYFLPVPDHPNRFGKIASAIFISTFGLGIPGRLIPWLTGFSL
jgi:hypothetical protein